MVETTFDYTDSIQQVRSKVTLYVEILSWEKEYYRYGISDKKGEIEIKDTLWVESKLRSTERENRNSLDHGN